MLHVLIFEVVSNAQLFLTEVFQLQNGENMQNRSIVQVIFRGNEIYIQYGLFTIATAEGRVQVLMLHILT